MIIADTNVVAEFMKDEPDAAVFAWAQRREPAEVGICVVTVQEVERGLRLLPRGRRRQRLEARWEELITAFAQSIALYDLLAAQATAEVLVTAQRKGRPMALADAQIAGICRAGRHHLATRNVRDFATVADVVIADPFARQ